MSAPDPIGLGDGLKRAADATTPRPLDVDAVLAASRSRRRARRTAIATGAGAVAAVLAVGGLVFGLQGGGGVTTADAPVTAESSESADGAPEAARGDDTASGLMLMAPESMNRCGAPVAPAPDAAAAPLTVSVVPPVAPVAPGAAASVEVTVTNASGETVTGDLSVAPAIVVTDAGIAVWHSSGTSDLGASAVTLAPGESTTLLGELRARRCTTDDDAGAGLPGDLPPLAPGGYAVGAVIAFSSPADGSAMLLTSPYVPFTVG